MTIFYHTSTNSFYIESLTHIWRFLNIIQKSLSSLRQNGIMSEQQKPFQNYIDSWSGQREGGTDRKRTYLKRRYSAAQSKEFTDTAFYHCSEICNILVKFTERQIFTQACLIYKLHNKLATHMVASGQTIDFFEWRATKVIQQKAYLYLFSLSSLSLSLPSFITKIDESPLLTFIIKWSKNRDERW